MQEGIQDEYHAFIKPNPVPLGFRSRCMDSERDVHKIPLSGELAHESVQEIYKSSIFSLKNNQIFQIEKFSKIYFF